VSTPTRPNALVMMPSFISSEMRIGERVNGGAAERLAGAKNDVAKLGGVGAVGVAFALQTESGVGTIGLAGFSDL
jgi:hypothetical protein